GRDERGPGVRRRRRFVRASRHRHHQGARDRARDRDPTGRDGHPRPARPGDDARPRSMELVESAAPRRDTRGTLRTMTNAVRPRERLAARAAFKESLSGDARRRLMQPLILFSADEEERRAIPSLPGQHYLSLTEAVREARVLASAGIAGVLLFAAPDRKDETAVLAAESDWLVPRAIRAIKDAVPELAVATDVCVCAYTRHGQCVLFTEGAPDIAATHARLAEIAVAHAAAGADLVIPSGMLAGSGDVIRRALDAAALGDVAVAGVVKFESALYEPY